MKLTPIFVLALIASLLAGCQAGELQAAPELPGTGWLLAALGPDWPVDPAHGLTLQFDLQGFVRGSSGCNEFNGPYRAAQGEIHIGPLAVTERACLDGLMMDQEGNYLQALEQAVSYTLLDNGQRLLLHGEGGRKPLEFTRR